MQLKLMSQATFSTVLKLGNRRAFRHKFLFYTAINLYFRSYVAQWELHNLYSSPDSIRQIKSRRMGWAGHVARIGEGRNVYRVLAGKPEGKYHMEDQGVDGRMGSKWTFWRLVGRRGCRVDSPGSG
jgi:hypothetical protein